MLNPDDYFSTDSLFWIRKSRNVAQKMGNIIKITPLLATPSVAFSWAKFPDEF